MLTYRLSIHLALVTHVTGLPGTDLLTYSLNLLDFLDFLDLLNLQEARRRQGIAAPVPSRDPSRGSPRGTG